ncbi:MAG TPA: EamA family transporter, partial [Beijerinckiaceae bacterium]|nr:EamA family transporter [Beijerinckiaceae bacterium]
MWAGNAVAGRLAVGEVSPMALTCLRWLIALAALAALAGPQIRAEAPTLLPH